MANFQYTSDLLADVLYRSGELLDGTGPSEQAVIQFLNRAYNTIAMGGGEFNEEINEQWWWLHKDPPGVLVLLAPITLGSVTVTNNNNAILLTNAPAASVATWFFKIDGHPDVFRISAHTAGSTSATLDSVFTGVSGAGKTYKIFKLEYELPADCMRITDAMQIQNGGSDHITGVELSSLNRDYPLSYVEKGIPDQFANVTESKVRFNRYGTDLNGGLIRVEFDYLFRPPALVNAPNEQPLVPLQYRQILADIAYFYVLQTKASGDQASMAKLSAVGGLIKRALTDMANENHNRMVVHGNQFGQIMPRQQSLLRYRRPVRTESGFILG